MRQCRKSIELLIENGCWGVWIMRSGLSCEERESNANEKKEKKNGQVKRRAVM